MGRGERRREVVSLPFFKQKGPEEGYKLNHVSDMASNE